MQLTLNEKNRGIKIAWFFMIITIGSFLNDLKEALQLINDKNIGYQGSYELGILLGNKFWLITILGVGMILYNRTKNRKFGIPVRGPKFIDYVLLFILGINFIFPLMSGRFINGSSNDVLEFFYVTSSLLAYVYVLLAKPKVIDL